MMNTARNDLDYNSSNASASADVQELITRPNSKQLLRTDSKRGRLQDMVKAGAALDEVEQEDHSADIAADSEQRQDVKPLITRNSQEILIEKRSSSGSPKSQLGSAQHNPFMRKNPSFPLAEQVSEKQLLQYQNGALNYIQRQSMKSEEDRLELFPNELVNLIAEIAENGQNQEVHNKQFTRIEQQTQTEKAFYKILFKQLGEFLYRLSQSMMESVHTSKITFQQLKTQYCWNTLSFMLDVCRAHDMSSAHNSVRQRSKMMTKFNLEFRKVFEFLQLKFAPLKNLGSVDCNILSRIADVNKKHDVSFDILTNCGMGSEHWCNKQDYSSEIKIFINKLIKESRKQYPAFMQTMQLLMENDFDDDFEENTCRMEIEAALMDSTELYSDDEIKAPGLKPKSGELLRIITFWTNELYNNFGHPEEVIVNRVGGFKSRIRGQGFTLTKKRRTTLADHLKEIFQTKIKHLKDHREEVLNGLLVDLLSGILKGYRGHQGLNSKEVMIAKLSQYLYECLQADLCIAINQKISMLNKVRDCYESEFLEYNIDLVTFGLMDLLKCKITGSKQQINRAYKRIVSNKQYYQIIQLKNRLGTNHNDLLIHLKLTNSFLICQIQLVLAEASSFSQNNNRNANLNFLPRVLRELRTSRFPVVYQCASSLIQLDPSINYFDSNHPVEFRGYVLDYGLLEFKDSTLYCMNKHSKSKMDYISSQMPFWCKACKVFFKAYTFGPEFLRCSQCLLTICPKCMLNRWDQFQQVFTKKYATFNFIREFLHPQPLTYGFYCNQEIEEKIRDLMPINGYIVLQQYDCHRFKTRILRKFGDKLIDGFITLRDIPKANVTDSKYNWCTLMGLKSVIKVKMEILEFYRKIQIGRPWHDIEEIFQDEGIREIIGCFGVGKVVLLIDLVENAEAIRKTIGQIQLEQILTRENTKEQIFLQLSSRNIANLKTINEKITNKQNVRLINLWQNKLSDIESLTQYPNMYELYLRQNYVSDIRPLLKLTNLLHLNLQRNNLQGSFPAISFPLLKSLDISCNRLTDVSQLGNSKLANLNTLLIGVNSLQALPILNCPNLDTFYFQLNSITNLDNLQKSDLPFLQSVHGCKNRLRGKLPKLTFPNLRDLWLHDNFIDDLDDFAGYSLPNFQWLRVTNNCVRGELPVFKYPSLCNMELENNEITGIGALSRWKTPVLQTLVLGCNRIEGALPVMSFSQLKLLNLSRNTLSSISNIVHCSINQIQQLDLSHNQICGALPVIKFAKLSRLCFEMNRFDDAKPLQNCILPALQFLDISFNHIRTSIPILQFENLRQIRISQNAIRSLYFLKESQLVPKLKAIIVHPSQLVLLPEQEAKLRTYTLKDEFIQKRKALERKRIQVQKV